MARAGGDPCPPPRRPTRKSKKAEPRVDAAAVWVAYQLVGATQAAQRHDVSRRTVYRVVCEVEADPTRLAEAQERLAERKATAEQRRNDLEAAAHEALLSRIRAGTLHPRHLVALAGASAPRSAQAGRVAMELPHFLTSPRPAT